MTSGGGAGGGVCGLGTWPLRRRAQGSANVAKAKALDSRQGHAGMTSEDGAGCAPDSRQEHAGMTSGDSAPCNAFVLPVIPAKAGIQRL